MFVAIPAISKNEPDSDDSVSIEKLPRVVNRLDNSALSSFDDYSTLDDFLNNSSGSDEEIDMVDAFAYFDMTNQDYRNLGKIHEGPRNTAPNKYNEIENSVLKVETYYAESNAKDAFKY